MTFEVQDDEIVVNFESPEERDSVTALLGKLPADDPDVAHRDQIVGELQHARADEEDWLALTEDQARTMQVCLERYGDNDDAMRLLDAMNVVGA